MLTQIKGPNQHFNAYSDDNSVLIQFVLAEFITTHQLACQIKQYTYVGLQSSQALEELVRPLFQCLNQLLGTVTESERLSVSRWTKGPLTKLKTYCEQFAQNTQHQNKRSLTLYTYVHQAWLSALHNLELLNILQQSLNLPITPPALMSVKRALNHLEEQLDSIVKHIPRVIGAYHDNENVLFFLLRWKEPLANIYGSDFIPKIFKGFSQTNDLPKLLIQRYLKRGFDHLLPIIHETSPNESACL